MSAAPSEPAGLPLLTHDAPGRATITLNRPQHANRLHREDLLALQAHISALAADPLLRVVVLTGNGPHFCAGFNLQELGQADAAGADPQLFEHTVDALEALPVPTIARLNGGVFGGATDLALACDFRVGVQGMRLRMPAARIGLHYYASGLQRYVSRLGLAAAKRLFLLATRCRQTNSCSWATSTSWWHPTRWTARFNAGLRRCWRGHRWRWPA